MGLNFYGDEDKVLSEIAYCWRAGFRLAKIKEHLNLKGYNYEMNSKIASKCFHKIMDNGGIANYL